MAEGDDVPVVVLDAESIRQEENERILHLEPRNHPAPVPSIRRGRWSSRLQREVDPGRLAEDLAKRLEHASGRLLDRLFEYLEHLPNAGDGPATPSQGLTLPLSAVGWLSSQLFPTEDTHLPAQPSARLWMGASMRDRLSLLKYMLPRATHLRITADEWPPPVKRTEKDRNDTHASFEGRDLSFSAMSVHSAITLETMFIGGAPPSIQGFLIYYHGLQNRPRVDLRLFPNLSVLLLDRVAPESLVHFGVIHNSLHLLRVERGCIFNLTKFLFDDPSDSDDEHGGGGVEFRKFQGLTHLKMTYCGIGEMSGLRGKKKSRLPSQPDEGDPLSLPGRAQKIPPPFSRLPNLVSISLSHNEIRKVRTACAGLSTIIGLRTVDLSYNYLTTMNGCNAMLGSITTLRLSGNRLEDTRGLEKLYSLQTLYLDGNNFQDIASIAGLANLPELTSLYLENNPLVSADPKGYRVSVFDLFKERRMASLGQNATYRQLFLILPRLDGDHASRKELLKIRGLTFKNTTLAPPTPVPTVRSQDPTPAADNNSDETPLGDANAEPSATKGTIAVVPDPVVPSRPRRVNRAGKRRRVRVAETTSSPPTVQPDSKVETPKVRNRVLPNVGFTAKDIIASIVPISLEDEKPSLAEEEVEVQDEPITNPDQQEVDLAIENLEHDTTFQISNVSTSVPKEENTPQANGGASVLLSSDPTLADSQDANLVSLPTPDVDESASGTLHDEAISSQAEPDNIILPGLLGLTMMHAGMGEPDTVGDDEFLDFAAEEFRVSGAVNVGDLPDTMVPDKGYSETREPPITVEAEDAIASTGEKQFDETTPNPSATEKHVPKLPTGEMPFEVTTSNSPLADKPVARLPTGEKPFEVTTSNSPVARKQISDAAIAFPEHVWDGDAQSVPSSLGTSRIEDEYQKEDKYNDAEQSSDYDGPAGYKHLRVGVNLELYFRSFVFASPEPEPNESFATGSASDVEVSRVLLESAPRIQLRPVDRKSMEINHVNKIGTAAVPQLGLNEKFVKMFKEEVLACGKPAARRLMANRSLRRGFHGDIMYANGKIQQIIECRKLILCCSNAAIYFIPDLDALSAGDSAGNNEEESRKFPSPIPEDAHFLDAPWPHAVARHPVDTLKRVTIGFGFQRLVLHFEAASEAERMVLGNDYTYIVCTSNKVRTVAMLQHLQSYARDLSPLDATNLLPSVALAIDNDDKQVLDALNVSVAPNVVGIVLHYQILQQQWKHGDRGAVRRSCVVTDTQVFLLDEDYVGDGSESFEAGARAPGEVRFQLVDEADLIQIIEVQAASSDPKAITIVIRPSNPLQRTKNWRLLCRDSEGAERLVDDVRKAMAIGF